MRPIRNKQNRIWMRCLALALLLGCVLAIVPTQLFAQWIIHLTPNGNTPVTDTTPKYNVNFKYFADNMYAPPDASKTTYNFYQFDPSSATNNYCGAAIATGSTTNALTDAQISALTERTDVTYTTNTPAFDGSSANKSSGLAYCGCTGLLTCDQHSNSTAVTYTYGQYKTTSYSFGKVGDTDLNVFTQTAYGFDPLFDLAGPSLTCNPRTDAVNTTKNTTTGTVTLQFPIANTNATLVVVVSYSATVTLTATSSAASGTCGGKRHNIISTCSKSHYKYTGTFAISNTVTYKAYVCVSEGDSAKWQSAEVTSGANGFTPYSYTVMAGDAATLPAVSVLKENIPTAHSNPPAYNADGDIYSAAVWQQFYAGLLYPIGYYQAATYAEALTKKAAGQTVTFPIQNVSADVTIWVDWGTDNPNNKKTNNLNQLLTNSTTGTYKPFVNNGDYISDHDLTQDHYFAAGVFYLYTNKIAADVDLLFSLNRGVTNVDASEYKANGSSNADISGNATANTLDPIWNKADRWVSEEYCGSSTTSNPTKSPNPLDYTVVLQNDLRIAGLVEIGGYTGAISNYTMGHIIGSYVKLDLNGHNIIVENGGILHSYGIITDSVGTGTIYVEPGGTLLTQMVTYDVNGGNQTAWRYTKDFCPFEQYNLPYLRARVELLVNQKYGESSETAITTTGAGRLRTFTKMNLGDLAFRNIYINLAGGDSGYLFRADTAISGKGKIVLENYQVKNAVFNDTTDVSIKNFVLPQCLDRKTNVIFDGIYVRFEDSPLNITISKSIVSATLNMAFSRMIFPVSTLMDLTIANGGHFTLSQAIQLQPGCTITVDSSSAIAFGFENNKNFPKADSSLANLPGVTKDLAGTIYACDTYLTEDGQRIQAIKAVTSTGVKGSYAYDTILTHAKYASFWKAFGSARLNIYGTLQLIAENAGTTAADQKTPDDIYAIAGNVTVNRVQIVRQLADKTVEPYAKYQTGAFQWSVENLNVSNFTDVNGKVVPFRTYDLQASPGTAFWMNMDNLGSGLGSGADNSGAYSAIVKYHAAPVHSGGVAYLFDSTDADYQTGKVGTYDTKTGLMKVGSTYYAFKKTSDHMLKNANNGSYPNNYQNNAVDYAMTVWAIGAADVDEAYKSIAYGGKTYVYFAGQYLEASAIDKTAGTATVNMQAYVSVANTYRAMNLVYNADTTCWTLSAVG